MNVGMMMMMMMVSKMTYKPSKLGYTDIVS